MRYDGLWGFSAQDRLEKLMHYGDAFEIAAVSVCVCNHYIFQHTPSSLLLGTIFLLPSQISLNTLKGMDNFGVR